MNISVGDLVNKIKQVFDSSKVQSVDTVYERIENSEDLKLIVFLNRILYDDINIIYTKLIFISDKTKTNIVKNYFTYLFDINCEYHRINFSDVDDFSNKITDIFKNNKFGNNIKILSKFIKSPATLINEWFRENEVSDISVTGFKYEPKIKIMPCKSLFFSFEISISTSQTVKLEISKEKENKYLFEFKIFDQIYNEEQSDLNNLVQVIGNALKNKIKI